MSFREINYPSANGVNTICAYVWTPEDIQTARGIVQIAHGMAEHALRYEPFAEFLTDNGFIVCANDHTGHGRSADGLFGYFGERGGHKVLAKDAYRLFCIMKKQYPTMPYILFGHDLGSLVARYVSSLWGIEFDGMILSGTGRMISGSNASAFVSMLGNLRGPKRETKLFARIKRRAANRTFKGEDPHHAWLTRDVQEIETLKADPLYGFTFTYAGIRDILKLSEIVSGSQWAARVPKDLPMYLFSGLDDPIGDFGRGVLKVYERLVEVDCENVEIKLYEDARHDMLFEQNKDEVYSDILHWLSETLSGEDSDN